VTSDGCTSTSRHSISRQVGWWTDQGVSKQPAASILRIITKLEAASCSELLVQLHDVTGQQSSRWWEDQLTTRKARFYAVLSNKRINILVTSKRTDVLLVAQLTLYRLGLTLCTTITFCPHSVFMCFVWIWEQTAIISLYSINWLVIITETECVYCAVRSAHTVYLWVLCGSENKQRLFHCTTLTDWFL
jgi:hypothetical protein